MSKLLYESMVNRAKDINLDFTPTKKESSVYDNVEDDMFFSKVVQEADESTANEPQAPDAGEGAQKIALLGALTLYLDFINLFIYLLRIFGKRD